MAPHLGRRHPRELPRRRQRNYTEELGLKVTFHGFSASPLALNDRLILVLGGTVLSVAKKGGKVQWRTADEGDGGYSNPVPFTLGGRRQLAIFAGSALLVLDTETGKERYRHPWKPKGGGVNCATPIVMGEKSDRIFISTAYNMGSALLQLGAEPTPKVLWKSRRMRNKCSSCVLHDGHIYGFDESMLCCIDLDGKRMWRMRGLGMGSVAVAGGRLIVLSSKGELLIGKASAAGFVPEYRRKILDDGVYWTSPVLLNGFLFCRSSLGKLVCLDHRDTAAGAITKLEPVPGDASETLPKAEDLFARHAKAIGAAALRKVRTATFEGTIEGRDVGLTPSPLKIQLAAPNDRILTIDHGRYGAGRYGFDAEQAWELDALMYERVLESKVHRELIETQSLHAFAGWHDIYKQLTTNGRKRFAGQDCWVVVATSKRGVRRTLYFACKSSQLVGHEAEGESLVSFGDWRAFGDIRVPTTIKSVAHDTGNEETRRIVKVTWNGVDRSIFTRPAAVTRMLRTPEQIAAENEAAKKRFAAHLGSYAQTEPSGGRTRKAKITVTDGYLSFEPARGAPTWFLPPDTEGILAGRDRPVQLSFTEDQNGKVTGMTLKTRTRTYVFHRTEPGSVSVLFHSFSPFLDPTRNSGPRETLASGSAHTRSEIGAKHRC